MDDHAELIGRLREGTPIALASSLELEAASAIERLVGERDQLQRALDTRVSVLLDNDDRAWATVTAEVLFGEDGTADGNDLAAVANRAISRALAAEAQFADLQSALNTAEAEAFQLRELLKRAEGVLEPFNEGITEADEDADECDLQRGTLRWRNIVMSILDEEDLRAAASLLAEIKAVTGGDD